MKEEIYTLENKKDIDMKKLGSIIDHVYITMTKDSKKDARNVSDILSVTQYYYLEETFRLISEGTTHDKVVFCSILRARHERSMDALEIENLKELIRLKHWTFKFVMSLSAGVILLIIYHMLDDGSLMKAFGNVIEIIEVLI